MNEFLSFDANDYLNDNTLNCLLDGSADLVREQY